MPRLFFFGGGVIWVLWQAKVNNNRRHVERVERGEESPRFLTAFEMTSQLVLVHRIGNISCQCLSWCTVAPFCLRKQWEVRREVRYNSLFSWQVLTLFAEKLMGFLTAFEMTHHCHVERSQRRSRNISVTLSVVEGSRFLTAFEMTYYIVILSDRTGVEEFRRCFGRLSMAGKAMRVI